MRISRRAAAVAAAVVTGLASLTGAGAALASSSAPGGTQDGVQVLRLHSVGVSQVVNDAGHHGAGDVVALVFDVRTPGGAEAGKAYLSCTSATASVNLCHAAYVLKGGQIDVQVAVLGTGTQVTLAVTGGTGVYAGVTGWARAVDADRTFYLIRPGQN